MLEAEIAIHFPVLGFLSRVILIGFFSQSGERNDEFGPLEDMFLVLLLLPVSMR